MYGATAIYNLNATTATIIVDVLAAIVLLIFALVATKKGFIECFFGLISTVLAIILAFALMKAMLRWTSGLFGLQGAIENGCTRAFSKIKGFDIDVSSEGLRALLEEKHLPKFLINSVVDTVGNSEVAVGTTVAMILAQKVGGFAASLLSWFFVFLLVKLLLLLLRKALTAIIERIPIVNSTNRILGFLVGSLQGLFIVSGVVAVLALIPAQAMNTFFNDCVFIGWLYNHNPIHTVFGWILS